MLTKYKVIFFDLGDTLVTSPRTWLPGAEDLLRRLRQNNLRLGIISNTANMSRPELANLLPPDFAWASFEEKLVVLSSEVGVEKPALGIFHLAVSRSGLASGLCLFCSENPLDCLAAQRAGLHAYRVQKPPAGDIAGVFLVLKELEGL